MSKLVGYILSVHIGQCKRPYQCRRYEEQFSRREDPRGRAYYWLSGEVINDLESAGEGPRDWPSDVAQIHANAPSLTPIQPDLFWRGALSSLPTLRLNDQLVR